MLTVSPSPTFSLNQPDVLTWISAHTVKFRRSIAKDLTILIAPARQTDTTPYVGLVLRDQMPHALWKGETIDDLDAQFRAYSDRPE